MRIKKYNPIRYCDDLWAEWVKLRDGKKCVKCGTEFELHSHHIIKRGVWNLRYDIDNGLTLCFYDHFHWLRQNPMDYIKWLNDKYPGLLDKLELKRYEKARHDYTLLVICLESEIRKLKRRQP